MQQETKTMIEVYNGLHALRKVKTILSVELQCLKTQMPKSDRQEMIKDAIAVLASLIAEAKHD